MKEYMGEINNILNDESNNDYQLVKELSIFIRNHKSKNLAIDKRFIRCVVDIIMRNSQIDYSDIEITNFPSPVGEYEQKSKTILINISKLYRNSANLNKIFFNPINVKIDDEIIRYYYSLGLIIHEVTHARQYQVIPDDKYNIYNSCYELCTDKEAAYNKNHDMILFERYATLRGFTLAYKILSYVYPLKEILHLRKHIYAYLLYGYTADNYGQVENIVHTSKLDENTRVISAIDNCNAIMEENAINKIHIESNSNMTLYDRLYLGLPLSLEEYRKILNMDKLFTSQEDVHNIILRL